MKRVVLPLLLLTAVACAREASPPAAAPTTAAPSTAAPSASPSVSTSVVPGEPRYFLTPTKNVGCGVDASGAACDIREKSWTPPSKPGTCEFDWGGGLVLRLRPEPKAEIACASDTPYNTEAPTLAYGQKITVGSVQCESRNDGVRCADLKSGRGFFLSRARYETF